MTEPTQFKPKRPHGLTAIAIIWLLSGLYNIFISFLTVYAGIYFLPMLSELGINAWLSFGLYAEIATSTAILFLGVAQSVISRWLWLGKSYAYKLAFFVPLIFIVINVLMFGVYSLAPPELGISIAEPLVGVAVGIFWVVIYWKYLGKPHVKSFFGVQ